MNVLAKHYGPISSGRAVLFALLALLLMLAAQMSRAQGESLAEPTVAEAANDRTKPADPAPLTTADPGVTLEDLEIMLEPMTRGEIEIEAKGWFSLLRAKVSEISVAELTVRRKNREIAQLEKQKTAAEALAEATKEIKSQKIGEEATSEEKAAVGKRLAEARNNLAKTVETAQQEAAHDKEQATVAENVTNVQKEEAAKAVAPARQEAGKGVDVTEVAVAAAQQKAAENGEIGQAVSAAQKEAFATDAVKSLVDTTPEIAASGTPESSVGPAVLDSTDRTAKQSEQLAEKAKEATGAKIEVKVALVDYSTKLASERTALADRLKLVLDKWELKGGDPAEYRQYIASIGGFKIDVSDKTATWARIKAWLVADENGLRWTRNFGIFVGYMLGSIIVAWIARRILRRVMKVTNVSSNLLREFVVAMSGRAIVFFGTLLGLSALEVNLAPILAALGAAGFVVAFALQGTLSNFASGLLIMVNKPFDVGDQVEIGSGIKGKVQTVSIFSTLVDTDDGLKMIVPNNTVWSGVIVNHSTSKVNGV